MNIANGARGTGVMAAARRMACCATAALLVGSTAAQAVDLRWGVWASTPEEAEIWEVLADLVTQTHPDITITLETAPWGAYWDKLTTQFVSGTTPDIVSLHHLQLANYAQNELLLDIGPLIEASPELDYSDFYPAAREGLSLDGVTYGLSYGIAPYILFVNKDIFNAAGLPVPPVDAPLTFAEFTALSAEVSDPENGIYGFTLPPDIMSLFPFMLSNGAHYLNEDGSASAFASEAALGGLEVALGMFQPGGPAAPVRDLVNPTNLEDFAAGRVAMMAEGSWQIGNMVQRTSVDWDIRPMPAGSDGSVTWSGVSGFAPSATTENQEAAWRAVMVLTGPEAQQIIGASGREFPSRSSALQSWLGSDIAPENGAIIPAILSGENPDMRAFPWKGGVHLWEIWNIIQREIGPVALGEMSVADFAQRVDTKINDALAQ